MMNRHRLWGSLVGAWDRFAVRVLRQPRIIVRDCDITSIEVASGKMNISADNPNNPVRISANRFTVPDA